MEGAEIAEDDGRRRKTEGDVISQRVEFLTDGRTDTQQTGTHAVEEIEDGADDDEQQCQLKVALKGEISRDAA